MVEAGSRTEEIVQSIDFFPTLLELTGVPRREGQSFDGVSIVPALGGEPLEREAIFVHSPHYTPATLHRPSTSVRRGNWKLIRFHCDGPGQHDRHELYNLAEDVGEQVDLSGQQPSIVSELSALLDHFLTDTGAVVPQPNPRYRPGANPFPNGPALRDDGPA